MEESGMKNYVVDSYENYKEENHCLYSKILCISICCYERWKIFGQDGIAPLLSRKVDSWNEAQFRIWCDYHYTICREQSILGSSNHVVIIGQK